MWSVICIGPKRGVDGVVVFKGNGTLVGG
jgi:hypothetical protein